VDTTGTDPQGVAGVSGASSTATARRVRFSPRQRRRVLAKSLFLVAGTLSFLLSVWLWFIAGDRETGLYVGLWVPSIFSLGALVVSWEGDA
jgi:hypothetical protein